MSGSLQSDPLAVHAQALALLAKLRATTAYPTAETAAILTKTNTAVEDIEGTIHCSNAFSSPVSRIPPEILCDCFRRTLPHARIIRGTFHNTRVPTAPWRLAHVCRDWREAALQDAQLWSSIHISSTAAPSPFSKIYALPALETQILRSGSAPLDIFLRWVHVDDMGPLLLRFAELLVDHSVRWRSLKFIWDEGMEDILLTLSRVRGRLPLLESVQIRSPFASHLDIGDVFTIAPQLQEFILTSCAPNINVPWRPFSAPWQQITHLRAHFVIDGEESLKISILQNIPNLVDCGILMDDVIMASQSSIIVLPCLRRLFVSRGWVLSFLETPKLEYLFVKPQEDHLILPFLRRSGCQLTGLKVFQSSSPNLIHLLTHLPTLAHFEISFYQPHNKPTAPLFHAMAASTAASTMLCPHLESMCIDLFPPELELFRNGPASHIYRAVAAMAESRWANGSLKRLRFHAHTDTHAGMPVDRFNALRGQGLDILVFNDRYSNSEEMILNPDMICP
ncbi:hypothetical protein C8F04DRAFT_1079595 [Mycena alexandri]|uniref:F-box domain-containing protein n=1 Tax=Mycena alexandri TaxID=1745969 RepID=A0AAD6X795_9AGAR|nr:hypothetical protein C8F04DRAFT_1079595 [Mycena alexandri]